MLDKKLAAEVAKDYRAMIRMARYCESAEEYYVHIWAANAWQGMCWYVRMMYDVNIYSEVYDLLGRLSLYNPPYFLADMNSGFTIPNLQKCLQARVDWLHEKFGV